ncbi:MAG: hypothetical protein OZ948_19585, partial [Deltaproteobacteria bacterium]|nr:hypothetical protein [Deltaproteobacteria bacterium]
MRLIGPRAPRPDPELRRRADVLRRSSLFDEAYYRALYTDMKEPATDCALHYLSHGAREGRRPHPLFDPSWYREQHPEVEASGLDPLTHYLEIGAEAGFDPNPFFDGDW